MICPSVEAYDKCIDSQGADGYPVLAVCEENQCTPSDLHTYSEWCIQPPGWNPSSDGGNTNCDSNNDTTEEPVIDPFESCSDSFKFKMRTGKAKVTRTGLVFKHKSLINILPKISHKETNNDRF